MRPEQFMVHSRPCHKRRRRGAYGNLARVGANPAVAAPCGDEVGLNPHSSLALRLHVGSLPIRVSPSKTPVRLEGAERSSPRVRGNRRGPGGDAAGGEAGAGGPGGGIEPQSSDAAGLTGTSIELLSEEPEGLEAGAGVEAGGEDAGEAEQPAELEGGGEQHEPAVEAEDELPKESVIPALQLGSWADAAEADDEEAGLAPAVPAVPAGGVGDDSVSRPAAEPA
jgi:hypothetical protein